jgi:hypothetical protein
MTTTNLDFKVKNGLQVTGNVTLSGTTNNVGTITTGIWNGSVITPSHGGTGQDLSASSGYMLMTGGVASVASTVPFSSIASTPTTLAGYGITNAQSLSTDLTAIAALAGTTGHLQKTSAGAWTLDTNTYLTANQIITATGDVTGSGTTSLNLTLTNTAVTPGTYKSVTVDSKGRVTNGTTPTTLSGYGITDAAPLSHITDYTLHLTSTQNTWIDAITATSTEVNHLTGVITDVQPQLNAKVALAGATMTGNLVMSANTTVTVPTPTAGFVSTDAVNKAYVDALATSGVVWESPINDPDLTSDNISVQPASPVDDRVYIIGAMATGAFWAGKEGHAVTWNGTTWIDLLGRAVVVGDRFGVTVEDVYTTTGGLVGHHNSIAQITNATPGAITYTFTAPIAGTAVFCNNSSSYHFAHSYAYVGSSWIEISGPSATPAGIGLYYAGNTLNVGFGAGIAQLPTADIGVNVYAAGGLMTTIDGTTPSTAVSSQLSLTKLGTPGTYKSVTTDAYGRVSAGTNPTTLAGYGIVDAQSLSADLTAIAALVGISGHLQKTGVGTWALDTNTYLTTNQTITLTGDVTGTGNGSFATTLANSGVTLGTYNNSATAVTPFTVDVKGRVTSTGTNVTITPAFSSLTSVPTTLAGYGITNAQSLSADLTAIAALVGTTGALKKTGAGTWALDTTVYSTTDTNVTLSNSATNATFYVSFAGSATGNQALNTNAALTFNPSTGVLYTTGVAGTLVTAAQPNITSVGTITTGTWSGLFGTGVSGSNLISLTGANITGTVPTGVLGNSTLYIGTTVIALNRASGALVLTGITSIDGNAATSTNSTQLGGVTAASYALLVSPSFTTPLLGTPTSGNLINCTFPTLNQNTTGTSANVTGIVSVANGGTGATTIAGASIVTYSGAEVLSNKRIDPRVSSAVSSASITPNMALYDNYVLTAQAVGLSINAPIGTPVDGDKIIFRILDNGTPQVINYNPIYRVIGTVFPTTTTANKTVYIGCIYNILSANWDVIAVTTQA